MNAAHVLEGVLTMIMKNLRCYKKYNIYLDKYDTQFAKKIATSQFLSLYHVHLETHFVHEVVADP